MHYYSPFWHPFFYPQVDRNLIFSSGCLMIFLQEQNPTQIYILYSLGKLPKTPIFTVSMYVWMCVYKSACVCVYTYVVVYVCTHQCLPHKLMIFPMGLSFTLRKVLSLCYKSKCPYLTVFLDNLQELELLSTNKNWHIRLNPTEYILFFIRDFFFTFNFLIYIQIS